MSFAYDDHEFSCRINDEASICTADLSAISLHRVFILRHRVTSCPYTPSQSDIVSLYSITK